MVDKVVDMPVVVQWQVPVVLTVFTTVDVQQLQFIDKVIDIPVVASRQIPKVQTMQNTVDRVVDTPVGGTQTGLLTIQLCNRDKYTQCKLCREP